MLSNDLIQIAMLDISPQNKAILEFYFDRAGKDLYNVVHEDNANAFIIDYDQYGAKEKLTEILEQRKLPVLLISIKERDIPSTIWLAKPLSTDALNKAADTVKELLKEVSVESENQTETALEIETEIETETEAEAEAEAEKAVETDTILEQQLETEVDAILEQETELESELENDLETISDSEIEKLFGIDSENEAGEEFTSDSIEIFDDVLNEMPVENETVILDDVKETNSSEKELEIDELNIEENQENHMLEAGLALAGAGAIASSALSADSNDDAFDFDVLEDIDDIDANDATNVVTQVAGGSEDSALSDLAKEFNEKNQKKDDVDSLLDSLIAEEDTSLEVSNNDNAEGDAFLDNLLADDELETINDPFDVLKSVDSELESNFDMQKSLIDESDDKDAVIEDDKTSLLIEENFTIHADNDPISEDVYADTLEVNYAEVKSDDDNPPEITEPLADETEDFTLGIDEAAVALENNSDSGLPEVSDDHLMDFDFNLEAEAPEKEIEIPSENLNEPSTTLELEANTDFELSLEETVSESDAEIADDVDIPAEISLDSLLDEVSNETNEIETIEGLDLDNLTDVVTEAPNVDAANATAVAQSVQAATEAQPQQTEEFNTDFSEQELQSLLNEVREEANNSSDGSGENSHNKTEAEKRWFQLCGNEDDIRSQKDLKKVSFNPSSHILGTLIEQIRTTKDKEELFRIKYFDLIMVIDHSKNKIYSNMLVTDDEFSTLCCNEIDPKKIKIHDLDYSEERLYRSKIEKNPNRSHSMESFIWTTSLLTSRGRLPENTVLSKVIGLKTWPNLTRLESIPNMMQLAAVFSKHPGSLLDMTKWLNFHQRYIFAFYNAALALDMIEFDSKKVKKSAANFEKKNAKKNKEDQGFFSRLLNRLKS